MSFHVAASNEADTSVSWLEDTEGRDLCIREKKGALPTGKEECDEAGFFGHVQLEAGAAEDVFYHSF